MVVRGTALSGRDGQATNSTNQETLGGVNAKSVGGLTRLVPLPRGIPTVDTSTSDRWPLLLGATPSWCNILFSPAIPFDFPEGWRTLLLQQGLPESRYHKNIAYRPGEDRLKAERLRISGIGGSEFPEPTRGITEFHAQNTLPLG